MAASAISLCRALGAVMSTMSISGSLTMLRQSAVARAKPQPAAARRAASSVTSATVCRVMSWGRSNTFCAVAKPKTWVLPMKPVPIRPRRSLGFSDMNGVPVDDQVGVYAAVQIAHGILDGGDGHALAAVGG